MNMQQAISEARKMVRPGIRGLGTMTLHAADGKSYGILALNGYGLGILIDGEGKEVLAESVISEIESVTTSVDELGGRYI